MDNSQLLDKTDGWVKRFALYGSAIGMVVGFITGFISGGVTIFAFFHDHEIRIAVIEKRLIAQEQWDYDRALDIENLQTYSGVRRRKRTP